MPPIRSILLVLASLLVAAVPGSSEDIQVSASTSRKVHAPGDSVLLIVKTRIPRGHRLYACPLGPGIGKPLSLRMRGTPGVVWESMLRTPPKKYAPELGDWVWVHEGEAQFFVLGTIPLAANGLFHDTLILDGLVCQVACMPVSRRVPVNIFVDKKASRETIFSGGLRTKRLLAEAVPMEMARRVTPGSIARTLMKPVSIATPRSRRSAAPAATVTDAPDPSQAESTESVAAPQQAFANAPTPSVWIPDWDYQHVEAGPRLNLILALVLAFLAGIVLNVMPCVLPVLGIKILSFSNLQKGSRRVAVINSLSFAAGMMLVFMILATLAAFAGFSWGQQFQNPAFLVAVIGAIVLFGLGLFDFFQIGVPAKVGELARGAGDGPVGNFLKGMLATVLSTPCSGPLLGATLAWALLQPPLVVYAVFAAVGSGMALPYVALSGSRRIARLIPRPGRWTADLKNLTGFLLLGFACYLMQGLPQEMVFKCVGMCVFLALGAWVWGRFAPLGSGRVRIVVVSLTAALIIAAGAWSLFGSRQLGTRDTSAAATADWQEFTPELLFEAHARGQHVLVNFTASWCMNCQYNRLAVLQSSQIVKLIQDKDVLALTVDLTNENLAGESLLHHLGSRSIPFLAIFKGDDPYTPVVMRDIIDKGRLTRTLRELREK